MANTGDIKHTILHLRGKFTLSLAFSPDGKYLASGAIDGIISVFDMETKGGYEKLNQILWEGGGGGPGVFFFE